MDIVGVGGGRRCARAVRRACGARLLNGNGPHQDGAADAKADAAASIPTLAPGKASVTIVTVDVSGVPTFTATVNSNAERQRLIDTMSARLGADKFHANISVGPDTKPASWLDKLDALMPVFTQAQVSIVGEKVELSGSAADSKFDWLGKLKALFGTGWTVDTKDSQTAASDAQLATVKDTSGRAEC